MSKLELRTCQAHVTPAALAPPPVTSIAVALRLAALMSAYKYILPQADCLMVGSPTYTLLVSAAFSLLFALLLLTYETFQHCCRQWRRLTCLC